MNLTNYLFDEYHEFSSEKNLPKKTIYNFNENETSIFYLYFYEKIDKKYNIDFGSALSELILLYGFIYFCNNNQLGVIEKKACKVFIDFGKNGVFKDYLILVYDLFLNKENNYSNRQDLEEYDRIFYDEEYFHYYAAPVYPNYEENDIVINFEDFLSKLIQREFLDTLYNDKIFKSNEERIIDSNDIYYNDAIDKVFFLLKKEEKSKFINKVLLTRMKDYIKDILDHRVCTLPFDDLDEFLWSDLSLENGQLDDLIF